MVIAEEAGLDLVLVGPDANPPVVSHHELLQVQVREREEGGAETRKKAAAARVEVKELKMRNIDVHDYGVSRRAGRRSSSAPAIA